MEALTKRYDNGEVTVIWKPLVCVHSGICVRGLPLVFDWRRRPWIELQHADTAAIVAQVERCPSGALSWVPSTAATADKDAAGGS